MRVKVIAAAIALIGLNFQCAEASEIVVSTFSYHFFQHDTNNENWGLHYVANNGFTVGAYRNSIGTPGLTPNSFHAGYAFPLSSNIGMAVGGVTGYGNGMGAGIAPYFSFSYRQKLTHHWGIIYTIGALQVVNLGIGYRF